MDNNADKRGILDNGIVAYRIAKDRKVFISWHGKHISTLGGRKAEEFIAAISTAGAKDAQLIMAKATGHFKHGNEKMSNRKR